MSAYCRGQQLQNKFNDMLYIYKNGYMGVNYKWLLDFAKGMLGVEKHSKTQ